MIALPPAPDAEAAVALLPVLLREARLSDAAVVVGPLPDRPEGLVRALETADVAVVLVDPRPFDPQWSPSRAVPSFDVTTDHRAPVRVWGLRPRRWCTDPSLVSGVAS